MKKRPYNDYRIDDMDALKAQIAEDLKDNDYEISEPFMIGLMAHMLRKDVAKGWILIGGTGSGKTSMAKCAKAFWNKGAFPIGHALIKTASEIAEEIRAAMDAPDFYKRKADIFSLRAVDNLDRSHGVTLFIDDLGVEPKRVVSFGCEERPMEDLITKRYELFVSSGAKTFFTTNLSEEDIRKEYGDRIVSRLREMCDFIYMGHEDYRTQK